MVHCILYSESIAAGAAVNILIFLIGFSFGHNARCIVRAGSGLPLVIDGFVRDVVMRVRNAF